MSTAEKTLPMPGVREYAGGFEVEIVMSSGRPAVRAYNEGGFNCTVIDLLDLMAWLNNYHAEIMQFLHAGEEH
jgi:hypothetical protein